MHARVAPLLLTLLCSGCVSQVLPPKVPESTLKIDKEISINPHHPPVYRDSLQSSIEGTGIFSRVTNNEPGETFAKVNRHVYGTPVIPILTILSLGIIPTIVEEESGHSFILHHRGKTHGIEATWQGATVLGWAALPLNLSPNRTSGDPKKHPRFYAFLKNRIEEALTR